MLFLRRVLFGFTALQETAIHNASHDHPKYLPTLLKHRTSVSWPQVFERRRHWRAHSVSHLGHKGETFQR